ncbi:zinc finger protein no ocelli [Leptinotarsa decemlineata]|uniref:zinc finger protein no ocelli n=1 Tax=Leptinotarsa decemlineata TaxID=7539 RepID=UPI000C255A7C|nr:zinc finger protein Noc [Leptinotarsa decemlineata]
MVVVLEGGSMLSSSNQYLQPDYLSPLPTTLDAKKSPLALLAQTCSQIGADSPSSKPVTSPLEKSKKSPTADSIRTSPGKEKSAQRLTPSENRLVFKPYETNVVSKKSDETRPSSKSSMQNSTDDKKSDRQSPGRKTVSPANSSVSQASDTGKNSPDEKSRTPTAGGASPIIRSGLEILQGHSKESALGAYKPGALSSGLSGSLNGHLNSLCCPPGLEQTNPAFRPPFPGAPYSAHQHAAMYAAAGYPGAPAGPYLSYTRVKTPSGGEALVPICKDPYCTGCQFSIQNQQLLMSGATGPCPSGCTQCDHQKYNLAMAMSLVPPGPSSLAYSQLGRPYVCNWIAGDTYCGKRFVTSEELLQHLRTHTNGTDPTVSSAASSLLNHSLFSTASLHRQGYPNAPLSPLSAARFHPYAKPSIPTTLSASPFSAFNPTALGPYYSAYSMYGPRLGAAVHQ